MTLKDNQAGFVYRSNELCVYIGVLFQ